MNYPPLKASLKWRITTPTWFLLVINPNRTSSKTSSRNLWSVVPTNKSKLYTTGSSKPVLAFFVQPKIHNVVHDTLVPHLPADGWDSCYSTMFWSWPGCSAIRPVKIAAVRSTSSLNAWSSADANHALSQRSTRRTGCEEYR